tara:strand:- start:1207 stop:1818 length:612 start_codon:yes stop_codon:yes gene_type:complete
MRFIIISLLLCSLCLAQSKYPADSLLISKDTPIINRIGLIPISLWQRISYNTNVFNCQFYPSCSNYGAQAIKEYGIIKGSIITSDRIVRCNPFAYHYQIELNRPFNEKDGRLIDPIEYLQNNNPKKSPILAGIFSAIIPGMGRVYVNRTMDGLTGLWTFFITANSTYLAFKNENYFSVSIFGIATSFVWLGEIYGAWRLAKQL